MPFDSQGKFTRLHNWEQDRLDDIDIVTDHHDEEDNNFSNGFNLCFLRDGRVSMAGNIDMGAYQLKNLKDGTSDTDAVNKKQVEDKITEAVEDVEVIIGNNLLIGDVKPSALLADHGGGMWLLANGRALSRTDYASLFAAIGTTYGTGDGSTTFNIPDCRGVVVRGRDNGRGLDPNRAMGSYQIDGAPEISGELNPMSYGGKSPVKGSFGNTSTNVVGKNSDSHNQYAPAYDFKASRSHATYGRSASEIRMKNIALNYFIKVK